MSEYTSYNNIKMRAVYVSECTLYNIIIMRAVYVSERNLYNIIKMSVCMCLNALYVILLK